MIEKFRIEMWDWKLCRKLVEVTGDLLELCNTQVRYQLCRVFSAVDGDSTLFR